MLHIYILVSQHSITHVTFSFPVAQKNESNKRASASMANPPPITTPSTKSRVAELPQLPLPPALSLAAANAKREALSTSEQSGSSKNKKRKNRNKGESRDRDRSSGASSSSIQHHLPLPPVEDRLSAGPPCASSANTTKEDSRPSSKEEERRSESRGSQSNRKNPKRGTIPTVSTTGECCVKFCSLSTYIHVQVYCKVKTIERC